MAPRKTRLALVILITGSAGRRLQDLRRLCDPDLAERIPPHITVVFPFEGEPSFLPLERHCWEVCHHVRPFWASLGEIVLVPEERLAYVEIEEGKEELAALREALFEGRYAPPRDQMAPYRPHVTIAQPQRESDFELARRLLAHEDLRQRLYLERLHLMAQYPDGSWYARDDYTLDGAARHPASGRGGP